MTKTDAQIRYSSMHEVKARLTEYLGENIDETKEVDAKDEGVKLRERWRRICAELDLDFRVTIVKCVRPEYVIFLSEFTLFEGVSTEVIDGKYKGEYAEMHMSSIPQRTFLYAAVNKRGTQGDFIHLTDDKYYARVPWRPEFLGIKRRKMRIVPVLFVGGSDGQMERVADNIHASRDRVVPTMGDVSMTHMILDSSMTEDVMGINELLISEVSKLVKKILKMEDMTEAKVKAIVSQLLEDALVSGKMGTKGLGGRIVSLFSGKWAQMLMVLFGLMFVAYMLNLIFNALWGWPMVFPGGGVPGAGVDPGGGQTAVTGPVTGVP